MKSIMLYDIYKNGALVVCGVSFSALEQYGINPTQLENDQYKAVPKQYPFPF
jgi:hypothetical protein